MPDYSKIAGLLAQTWPARVAQDIFGAVKAPHDVMQPRNDELPPMTTADMIKPAADLAGLMTMGATAAPPMRNAAGMGIRAYHGSPHDFDKFSLSKIGTGEGAQAYGHGLYFAEKEGTAKAYRDKLSGVYGRGVDGSIINTGREFTPEQMATIRNFAADKDLPAADAAKRVQWRHADLRSAEMAGSGPIHQDLTSAIERIRDAGRGRMYEVNINAEPHQFLDWDKPLPGDSPVRGLISDAARRWYDSTDYGAQRSLAKDAMLASDNPNLTGSGAYRNLSLVNPKPAAFPELTVKNPIGASEQLANAGIPGIKYLDQGSRGAGTGSSNYVVFDDKLIDILKKYSVVSALMGYPVASNLADQKELKQ